MKTKIYSRIITILIIALGACNVYSNPPKVKNVILIIGDGMGLAQIQAAMIVADTTLNIERAQNTGLVKTNSLSNFNTDSGAGGTALSSGQKINNYSIGVDTNKQPIKNICEFAYENGLSTGIVVTCDVTHATPAAFYSHQALRFMQNNIAQDYINSHIDIMIGGGALRFDTLGYTKQLKEKGVQVVNYLSEIDLSKEGQILCVDKNEHLPKISEGRGDYLLDATNIALNKISRDPDGFFMMIEGSHIDFGGHNNDIDYITSEALDLDKAIGRAFDFADKNPGTLVVVTADHETGGLTLFNGKLDKHEFVAKFSSPDHTGVMVPVYAYGTGSEEFTGIMDNTDIFHKIFKLLNLKSDED